MSHQQVTGPDLLAVLPEPSTTRPWPAVLDRLGAPPPHAAPPLASQPFPAVPKADFPVFRSAATGLLRSRQFARFDLAYRAAFAAARGEAPAWPHGDAADRDGPALIQRLTVTAASPQEVITRIRAAQAAFFVRGLRRCDAVLTQTQRQALHRLGDRDTGLDPDYAGLLHSIAILGLAPTETSRGTNPAVAIKLQRLGYVRRRHNSEHLAASNELAFSLLLDEPEPEYWRAPRRQHRRPPVAATATSAAPAATYPA